MLDCKFDQPADAGKVSRVDRSTKAASARCSFSATSVAQAGSLAQVGLDQNRLAFELGRMPRLRREVEHTPWPVVGQFEISSV